MKKEDREAAEKLLPMLPERPPEHVLNDRQIMEDLGHAVISYQRESTRMAAYYLSSWCLDVPDVRKGWMASCKCFACGDMFFGGYENGNLLLCVDDDGRTYDGFIMPDSESADMITEFRPGEDVECPMCGTRCELVTAKSLKNGRTYRTQTASLENINGYTVIMYWLAERRITRAGYSNVTIYPREAVAILPSGTLARFVRTTKTMNSEYRAEKWTIAKKVVEPAASAFPEGGYRSKRGSWYVDHTPLMSGTTGEKTGIEAYWGSAKPVDYLKLWKIFHPVEALAKTGANGILEDIIDRNRGCQDFDTTQRKPNRILQLSKTDYAVATANTWNLDTCQRYRSYKRQRPKETAADWQSYIDSIGLSECCGLKDYWNEGLGKIIRYLQKQYDIDTNLVTYYEDYRRMLKNQHEYAGVETYTEEERFPANLMNAHDRQVEYQTFIKEEEQREKEKQYVQTFRKMKQEMRTLEWTDGDIEIVIPEDPADLIREGNILHHCVGTYSNQHCNGKPIFFVRHHRRPERPWYTLNEDLTRSSATRVQLHGYRNEILGMKRLTIPYRVLKFVETWERDILTPWMKNRKGVTA